LVRLVVGGYVAGFKNEGVLLPIDTDSPLRAKEPLSTTGFFALEPVCDGEHGLFTDPTQNTGSKRDYVSRHTEGDQ